MRTRPIRFPLLWKVALLLVAFAVPAFALNVDSIKPSVVRIFTFSDGDEGLVTGSGFVVATQAGAAIVATNCHVVTGRSKPDNLMILRKTATSIEVYEGQVFWEDDSLDLALIRVPKLAARALTLFRLDPPQGEDVYALGFPGIVDDEESATEFGRLFKSSTSHILNDPTGRADRIAEVTLSKAGVRRVVNGKWNPSDPIPEFRIIEHDVNITSGNSGGPLLNACGHVVGVNTMRIPDASMPMDIVRKSSHASVLIDALNRQGIRASTTTAPCTLASSMSSWSGGSMVWIFAIMAAVAIGAALFFAIRRPAVIAETYTQFLRRGSPSAHEVAPPLPTPTRGESSQVSGGWLLEGINPEAGQTASIRLEITPQMNGKLILGRKAGLVHLLVKNTSVSGQHAAILADASGLSIEDRNSSNGTKVNGQRMAPFTAHPLKAGDFLEVGEVRLQVRQT